MSTSKPGKKPQDHQEPKPEVKVTELTIGEGDDARTVPAKTVTLRGIDVTIPDEALDDFEVLDDIRAIQDNQDASRMPAMLRRLVGDEYKTVLNALRGENGRVTVEDGSKFVMDLFAALAPN